MKKNINHSTHTRSIEKIPNYRSLAFSYFNNRRISRNNQSSTNINVRDDLVNLGFRIVGDGLIKSKSTLFLNPSQSNACKKIINKILKKKKLKLITDLNFNINRTKKSIGSRMGKGVGKPSEKVALVKKNKPFFKIKNIPKSLLQTIILKIKYKLPTKIVGHCKSNKK